MRLLYCLVFWQTHFLLACSFEASARACCVALSDGVPIKRTLERFIESCHISSASLQIRCMPSERERTRSGRRRHGVHAISPWAHSNFESTFNMEFRVHLVSLYGSAVRSAWHHRKSIDAKTEAERCRVLLEPFFLVGRNTNS